MRKRCALAAKKANYIFVCIKQSIVSRSEEVILPLCVQFWTLQYKKVLDILERTQRRVTRVIKGLEHLLQKEGLAEMGLFSLEKRGLSRDLINLYKHLKEGCKDDSTQFLPVMPGDRSRGDDHVLWKRRIPLTIRKHFFTARMTKHLYRLLREVVKPLSFEILKDVVLGN